MALLKWIGSWAIVAVFMCSIIVSAVVIAEHIAPQVTPQVGDVYADPAMNMEVDLDNPFDSVVIADAKFTVIEIKNDYCKYEGVKQYCNMFVDNNGIHRANEIMRDTASTKCNELDRLYAKIPKTHRVKLVNQFSICN